MTDRAELAQSVIAQRRLREDLLLRFYEATNGMPAPMGRCDYGDWIVGEPGGFAAVKWLEDAGLVKHIAAGSLAGLTVHGIEQAENLLVPPDDPMEFVDAVQARQIEGLVRTLEVAVERDEIDTDAASLEEIRALLLTIQGQLGARPRKGVVWSCLRVVRELLTNATGSIAGDLAIQIVRILAGG